MEELATVRTGIQAAKELGELLPCHFALLSDELLAAKPVLLTSTRTAAGQIGPHLAKPRADATTWPTAWSCVPSSVLP